MNMLTLRSTTPPHGFRRLYRARKTPFLAIPQASEGGQTGLTVKMETVELPEKYKLLSDLFFAMTCSVRLLNLNKKQFPVFHYISRQVERITGSKFSYRNLAQMKFIFPEAIQTDKILLRNNKTFLMEPHLKVSFLFDVVQGHTEPSDFLALYHAFSSRLLTFVRLHSEDFDVPEAELPEPFNHREIPELYKRREIVAANIFPLERLPPNDDASGLINSHVPPFKRSRFARMVGRESCL